MYLGYYTIPTYLLKPTVVILQIILTCHFPDGMVTVGLDLTPDMMNVTESSAPDLIVTVDVNFGSVSAVIDDLVVTLALTGMHLNTIYTSTLSVSCFVGTATTTDDYSSTNPVLTFSDVTPSAIDHTVTSVVDDETFEGFETVIVTIQSTNYDDIMINSGSFTFTITDHEG